MSCLTKWSQNLMKRIIVKSVLKDIKGMLNIPKNRSSMIESAPACCIPSEYPANAAAKLIHPENFLLNVKTCYDEGSICVAELVPADGRKIWFKAGQFIALKLEDEVSEFSVSLPVMSVPGESRVLVCVNNSLNCRAYREIKKAVGKDIRCLSFEGNFGYNSLRDGNNVSIYTDVYGIATVVSIVNSVKQKSENIAFSIIYCDESGEFPLCGEVEKSADISLRCVPKIIMTESKNETAVFVCGSAAFCGEIRSKLDSSSKCRILVIENISEPVGEKEYLCKVIYRGETFQVFCREGERLSDALEKEKMPIKVKCADGECGYCRSRLICGEVRLIDGASDRRTMADKKYGYIHPCCVTPVCDLTIEI